MRVNIAPRLLAKILVVCLGLGILTAKGQITGGPPATSLPTSADGGSLGSGKLNFQPDLFTGRFTYSVPIAVPPGRQNCQPKLALGYNSSVGNGWCGVGWQLELGKIERETRHGVPVCLTNGFPSGYDDGKEFSVDLGGAQGHLSRVSSPGQSPAQYRMQVDKSFLSFTYFNNVSNAYWGVVDKNGVQYYFGESLASRMDNPIFTNAYGTATFRWQLDRIVDVNGNMTSIAYTNIQSVQTFTNAHLYPLQICYNGNTNYPTLAATNTINFVLTTNRSEQPFSYISGMRVEEDCLLSQIVVQANGQPVRRYVLSYTNSPTTLRSLMTSVVEYGADDVTTLPPITFSYQVQAPGFGPLQSWGPLRSDGQSGSDWNSVSAADGSGNVYVGLVDIDGDGLPDRVMRTTNSPYNAFMVQRNTGSNFFGSYSWGGLSNNFNGYLTAISGGVTSAQLFDMNGDGRPDYSPVISIGDRCRLEKRSH